jgi:hypothetical protein
MHVPSSQNSSRRNSYIKPSEETPQVSSRRASYTKHEQQPIPVFNNKDSRRSSSNIIDTNQQQPKQEFNASKHKDILSSDTDVPTRTTTKHKREKSTLSIDDNDKQQSSIQRLSGQQSKRNSSLTTDETVVTPMIMNSLKARQQSGKVQYILTLIIFTFLFYLFKRASATDSEYEHGTKSKLPPVNSSFQQQAKPRHSETLNKKQIPTSNRSEIKQLSSSSQRTSPSDDDGRANWKNKISIPSIHLSDDDEQAHLNKKISTPSIHLTDDELSTAREDQPRPQSPNVDQIAERNQPSLPPNLTSTGKQRSAAG